VRKNTGDGEHNSRIHPWRERTN